MLAHRQSGIVQTLGSHLYHEGNTYPAGYKRAVWLDLAQLQSFSQSTALITIFDSAGDSTYHVLRQREWQAGKRPAPSFDFPSTAFCSRDRCGRVAVNMYFTYIGALEKPLSTY